MSNVIEQFQALNSEGISAETKEFVLKELEKSNKQKERIQRLEKENATMAEEKRNMLKRKEKELQNALKKQAKALKTQCAPKGKVGRPRKTVGDKERAVFETKYAAELEKKDNLISFLRKQKSDIVAGLEPEAEEDFVPNGAPCSACPTLKKHSDSLETNIGKLKAELEDSRKLITKIQEGFKRKLDSERAQFDTQMAAVKDAHQRELSEMMRRREADQGDILDLATEKLVSQVELNSNGDELEHQKRRFEGHILYLEARNTQLVEEANRVKDLNRSLEEEVQKLRAGFEESQCKLATVKGNLATQISDLVTQKSELATQVANLEAQSQHLEQENSKLVASNEDALTRLAVLTEDLKTQEMQFDDQKAKLEAEQAEVKANLERQNAALHENNSRLTTENESFMCRLAAIQVELQQQISRFEAQSSELNNHKEANLKFIEGLKLQKTRSDDQINKMKDRFERKLADIREELEQQRTRFEAQGSELDVQKDKNAKLNEELSMQKLQFEGHIKELKDDMIELKDQKVELETRVTDLEQEVSQLKADNQSYEDQIDILANDLETQSARVDEQNTVLKAQKSTISKLTKANKEGKKKLKGVEKELRAAKNKYNYLMEYVKNRLAEIEKVEEKKKGELDKMLKDWIAKLKKEQAEYEEQIKAREEKKKKEEEEKKRKAAEKERMGAKKRRLE